MSKYGKLLLFIVSCSTANVLSDGGCAGGVVMQRVQILALALALRSRMKQEIGNVKIRKKVYLRSQILERPSIDEYWNISGVPVLPENVIFTFFRTCRCYSEAFNTGTQKWSSIVQYSCTSIWDLKYTFSNLYFTSKIEILVAVIYRLINMLFNR